MLKKLTLIFVVAVLFPCQTVAGNCSSSTATIPPNHSTVVRQPVVVNRPAAVAVQVAANPVALVNHPVVVAVPEAANPVVIVDHPVVVAALEVANPVSVVDHPVVVAAPEVVNQIAPSASIKVSIPTLNSGTVSGNRSPRS